MNLLRIPSGDRPRDRRGVPGRREGGALRAIGLVLVASLLPMLLQAAPAPSTAPPASDDASRLFERAGALRADGRYAEAIPLAQRVIAQREELLRPDDPALADALNLLALLYDDTNDYAKAEPLNRRALAIRETALGPDHPDVARSLFNLAWIAKSRSDFAQAEALYARALAIQEKAFGPDHPEVATVLNDLAVLYNQTGAYDKAIATDERVLAIREKVLGPDDPGVAKALNNLAGVYDDMGDYPRAIALIERAVPIWEKALGPEHPEVAFGLDSLAKALWYDGDYARAEPLYLRALAIREKALGPEHPEVATTLNNLAVLYRQKGDYAKAESLLLRDRAITEKRLGPDHRFVAPTLTNLAEVYRLQGDAARAEPLNRRALAIYTGAVGPDHQDTGWAMALLGRLLAEGGPGHEAEAADLLARSLAILETSVGPDHPRVALPLAGLALLASGRGDREEATARTRRALAIQEKAFGPDHPEIAATLERLSGDSRSRGDTAGAVALLARSQEIRERHLAHNILPGSERQKSDYLKLYAQDADRAVSLHAQSAPDDPAALRLALTTLLRRKGRALDAMSDSVALLRRNAAPADRDRLDRLALARARLAAVTLRGSSGTGGGAYPAQIARLRDEVEHLESEVGAASAAFRAEARPVTLEAVQAAIPAGASLVEFALYRPDDDPAATPRTAATPAPLRYAAYTLAARGEPRWADLGDAVSIDRAVETWRAVLRDPAREEGARAAARALDTRIMAPVRRLVGDARHLLVSPDGALNLVPFAALLDEENHPLVEHWTITYLTSGRDLLRLQVPRSSRSAAAIVASPAFGDPPLAAAAPGGVARVDESQVFFGPLPGVAQEVRALRALLPEATVLTGAQATEAALRDLAAPSLLHIATHGFFLDGIDAPGRGSGAAPPGTRLGRWAAATDNPLLRSGLAMAGANAGASGSDDGVLTALEAAGLDLWGTKLVVLSACDTGLGEVRRGDGVYGLRRALVLAGAESQMMSLWPVSDRSTRDLMVGYYRHLMEGEGRGEALRQAQLRLLRDGRHAHPYYWAGFIESGEWGSLDGRR